MTDPPAHPHRPALYSDLTELIDAAGGETPSSRAEIAAATAAALLAAAHDPGVGERHVRFVELADQVGLDTLAALWRDCEPVSLPGSLWALYLLRQWCQSNGEEVAQLCRAGQPLAQADAVVAGLDEFVDADAVGAAADEVLAGACRRDFALALERAAALFRVVATGRRELAAPGPAGRQERDLARRNDQAGRDLTAAARRWRARTLH